MTWFYFALGTAVCWSVGQVFVKRGFANTPPLWNNIVNNLLALILWPPVVLWLSGFSINVPSPSIFSVIFISSCFYHTFFYAISKGRLSLTGTVIAGYPVATIVLSFVFLNERLALLQYIGILFILSGGVTVALPERVERENGKDLSWIWWGMAGAVLLGTGDFLTKVSVNHIGSYSHIFFLSIVSVIVSGLNFLIDSKNRSTPRFFKVSFRPTFIGILLHLFGGMLFLLAFDYGGASLIVTVSSVYPAFVVLLAIRFLGEKISRRQAMGIAVTVLGLLFVGLGTA